MAHYVDEDEGDNDTNNEYEMIEWLKSNNLHQVIPKFKEENMRMDELLCLGEDANDLRQYLLDLNLAKPSITRICSKIKKILNNKNKSSSKVRVVVLSENEENAMNELNKYNKNISLLIEELLKSNDKLIENKNKIKSQINDEFNMIINAMNNKQEMLLNKMENIMQRKQNEINEKCQYLESKQKVNENTLKCCNELIEDCDIDKNERKQKMLSMINNIINNKISSNVGYIDKEIKLTFNDKKSISTFVSNLCDIDCKEKHPLPVITDIKTDLMTNNQCRIYWNAELLKFDLNHKSKNKLFMKLVNINNDIDEKQNDLLNSSLIQFDKKIKKYQYKMNNLKKDKLYKMKMCLLDNNNNIICDEILFSFKTLGYDRKFIYSQNSNKNGIIYFIATNYAQNKQWMNPSKNGKIKLKSSGWNTYCGSIEDFLEREPKKSCTSSYIENGWISIDFGKNIKVQPTAYILMHGPWNNYYLKHWNIYGSDDGLNWDLIKKHSNDKSPFNKPGESKTFYISKCNKYYQMFKIQITAPNSNGNWMICCGGFEVFGYLRMIGNK